MQKIKLIIVSTVLTIIGFSGFSQITEIGLASFYADKFDGRVTASGEIFDQNKMTAAHRTLPFGSKVKVTNLNNRKSIVVIVNDRGPFVKDRVIDLSKQGAKKLDFIADGVTQVKVEVISLGNSANAKQKKQQKQKPAVQQKKPVVSQVKKTPIQAKQESISQSGTIANSGIEYYKLESELITPNGFGIQVASYQEAANLMKRAADIKRQVNKDVLIQVGNNNGSKVYRIIIGSFETRNEASNYNQKLKNTFKGSFVIGF